jgi:3-oxoacid CoA-transferase subunit A
MIYITGDTHGDFDRVLYFCQRFKTTKDDILIILGDAGINFFGAPYDTNKKEMLEKIPLTLFAIHGNHEQRPATIATYKEKKWHEGNVYYEEQYPHLIFAKDGEIYNFEGKKTIVIGGAYSVDKPYRLARGYPWWSDEQPSEEIKKDVEKQLDQVNWQVDVVLSHTVPLKYEPVEVFIPGLDQSKIDKSTEIFLGTIEKRLSYQKWYAGHYHINKKIDRLQIMFDDIEEFKI